MTGGKLPFREANKTRDKVYSLICDSNDYLFWQEKEKDGLVFCDEFKDLIISMF